MLHTLKNSLLLLWKSPTAKKKSKLFFALFYAAFVTLCTYLFLFFPAAIDFENYLYDGYQKERAIDSKSDIAYSCYTEVLDRLVFINLDVSFIDHETDRIYPDSLLHLLQQLQPFTTQTSALFLDYQFTHRNLRDTATWQATQQLLVDYIVPYSIGLVEPLTFSRKGCQLLSDGINITYSPHFMAVADSGYVFTFVDGDGMFRYFKPATDDGMLFSAPWQIVRKLLSSDKIVLMQKRWDGQLMHINYLLRNNEIEGKERAVPIYDASFIASGMINKDELQELLKGKIVMIGLAGGYKTKYNQEIDKFDTPIHNELSGLLVLTNIVLNLYYNCSLKYAGWIIVFWLNLLIGLLIGVNDIFESKKTDNNWYNLFKLLFKLLVSYIGFSIISNWYFSVFALKISLGMSFVLFQSENWVKLLYNAIFDFRLKTFCLKSFV